MQHGNLNRPILRLGDWSRDHPAWTLVILGLLVIATGLGLRDPWAPDEPRYALIARDMVLSGDWFFPRVAGVLYPDKPPVYFWLLALSYGLTGSVRWSFLLPSLFAALGTLLLVRDLGARLWSRDAGLIAAVLLLVTVQFGLQARQAQIDMTLCFLVTLGLYGLLRHLLTGPAWGWYTTGFAAVGLGIITKGVGFLPLLVFVPWGLARWRGVLASPTGTPDWRWLLGPLAMLAVIAAWLVPMLVWVATSDDGALAAYRDNILFKQTGERYADAWHHLKPWWYYLVEVIPLFWLPATLALPWLVPAWMQRVRDGDGATWLLLGWILLVVVFFSLSPGKRGIYMLPAVPALALACAPVLPGLLARRGPHRAGFMLTAMMAAAWLGLAAYYTLIAPDRTPDLLRNHDLRPWGMIAALGGLALAWLAPAPRRGGYALAGCLASFWIILGLWGYPLLNPLRTPENMLTRAGSMIGPEGELGLVDWKEQFILFADRPVVHFGYRREDDDAEVRDGLRWVLAGGNRYLLLPDEELAHACIDHNRARRVDFEHREFWWLVGADAITVDCMPRLQSLGPPGLIHAAEGNQQRP